MRLPRANPRLMPARRIALRRSSLLARRSPRSFPRARTVAVLPEGPAAARGPHQALRRRRLRPATGSVLCASSPSEVAVDARPAHHPSSVVVPRRRPLRSFPRARTLEGPTDGRVPHQALRQHRQPSGVHPLARPAPAGSTSDPPRRWTRARRWPRCSAGWWRGASDERWAMSSGETAVGSGVRCVETGHASCIGAGEALAWQCQDGGGMPGLASALV